MNNCNFDCNLNERNAIVSKLLYGTPCILRGSSCNFLKIDRRVNPSVKSKLPVS
jgi:hypothetical protein